MNGSPPLIEIDGAPRDRGRSYGEQAREQIAASLAYYRQALSGMGLPWEDALTRVHDWRGVVQPFAPDLLAEIAGIAEGAQQSEAEILALNCRSELLTVAESHSRGWDSRKGPPGGGGECTSFSLTGDAAGDGHVYCGQNWDWKAGVQESVVLMRVTSQDEPTIIMQVEAGQVGRHGANSEGLALNANALTTPPTRAIGVPQSFIRRRILECRTVGDALMLVMSVRQQVAANLLLTHRDGFSIDLETTPARHGWMYPTAGLLVHGNHYEAFVPDGFGPEYRPGSPDSLYRVPRLTSELGNCRAERQAPQVRKRIGLALQDHFGYPQSVCCHPNPRQPELSRWQTIASSVIDLTTGEYFVTLGPPCQSDHRPLPWNLYEGG
jgi:isopenicillin-N N-acyltransferase like protein